MTQTRCSDEYVIMTQSSRYFWIILTLTKLIDAAKAWRDSWTDILNTQQHLVNGFQIIYSPISGAGDQHAGHEAVATPASTLERVVKLDEQYIELKTDLLDEVNQVDARIVQPATRAKDYMQPMKKVLKKREDRKVSTNLFLAVAHLRRFGQTNP